ncbi:hypothetical protein V502_05959 [Pseudogymnoascus sp. VKM F-4520 (FW-2644)]|nr:hypothetical protein V502_05959 [Pseudogymnoascus sp. VKM F-4520 (FW-2644)]
MNVSEKQLDEPLLPITNPITHVNPQDVTATTSPSRSQKIFAAAEAFNRVMERVNRSFYAIAMFWMIVIQLLCLSVILWYSAELTYLFVIGRRVNLKNEDWRSGSSGSSLFGATYEAATPMEGAMIDENSCMAYTAT